MQIFILIFCSGGILFSLSSLLAENPSKKDLFTGLAVLAVTIFFHSPICAMVLFYLYVQAWMDAQSGYVDADLSHRMYFVMSALVILSNLKTSWVALGCFVATAAILFLLQFIPALGRGDLKGLSIIALTGLIYHTPAQYPWYCLFVLLIANLCTVFYGIMIHKAKEIPFFPGLWIGTWASSSAAFLFI